MSYASTIHTASVPMWPLPARACSMSRITDTGTPVAAASWGRVRPRALRMRARVGPGWAAVIGAALDMPVRGDLSPVQRDLGGEG